MNGCLLLLQKGQEGGMPFFHPHDRSNFIKCKLTFYETYHSSKELTTLSPVFPQKDIHREQLKA